MDENLAERGGWVRFCHFLGLFLLKIRLYLSVDFLIALADFLILSADTIRMLADSLIVSAREWFRLCDRREKSVDWSHWWKAKNRKFLYGCIELRGYFWPTNFYEKSEISTNKMKNLRSAWADDWSKGIKKSRPTSAGEVGREKL